MSSVHVIQYSDGSEHDILLATHTRTHAHHPVIWCDVVGTILVNVYSLCNSNDLKLLLTVEY